MLREAEPETKSPKDAALQALIDSTLTEFLVPKDPANSRYGVLLLKELCESQDDLNVVCKGIVCLQFSIIKLFINNVIELFRALWLE